MGSGNGWHFKRKILNLFEFIYFPYKTTTKQQSYSQKKDFKIRLDCPSQLCLHDTAVLPRGPGTE